MILTVLAVIVLIGGTIGLAIFSRRKTRLVLEDNVAVTVDRAGFVKRVLPAGRHVLYPFEQVDFTLETKTKLATGQSIAIATNDGLQVNINWSGLYILRPELITENISQRLRSLFDAQKTISRNVDICLRKLVGGHTTHDLFNPAIRERLERRLLQLLANRLQASGIVFNGLNLQAIELPQEVIEALNKAKAIKTLDGAIRQLDPTTREVVRGAYQLDEILHWDTYLPTPSRLTMKRAEATGSAY